MKGNRLRIPTLEAGTWHDKDHVMLHAAFTLLVDFVEKEWGGLDAQRAHIQESCDSEDEMSRAWGESAMKSFLEVEDLYNWWKNVRTDPWEEEDWREEERLHEVDNENFCRLVRLRRFLWT